MIDEFELFRARAYGLRDDSHVDRHRDDISEKSGDDVTSGSQRRMCHIGRIPMSVFRRLISYARVTR